MPVLCCIIAPCLLLCCWRFIPATNSRWHSKLFPPLRYSALWRAINLTFIANSNTSRGEGGEGGGYLPRASGVSKCCHVSGRRRLSMPPIKFVLSLSIALRKCDWNALMDVGLFLFPFSVFPLDPTFSFTTLVAFVLFHLFFTGAAVHSWR